jgi:hypothetical protein
MPAPRQQHLNLVATHNTSMTKMGREGHFRIEHATFNLRGEFFALFDARAEEVDFCFES